MKTKILILFFILFVFSPALPMEKNGISVTKVLTLGQKEGDDNYIFGLTEDIKVDELGQIYILDSERERVQKFDGMGKYIGTIGKPRFNFKTSEEWRKKSQYVASEIRKGIKPDELYFPSGFYYTNNKLYILDIGKVCIYSADNDFLGAFDITKVLSSKWIFVNNKNEIIIAGIQLDSDRILHVFDEKGNIMAAYGDFFDIPAHLNSTLPENIDIYNKKLIGLMKRMPSQCFYFDETHELYLLNPFKYEIKIYNDGNLFKIISHERKGYKGFAGSISHYIDGKYAGFSAGYISPPTIIKKDDNIFVFHSDSDTSTKSVDVFKNYVFQISYEIDIDCLPVVMDKNGYIYGIGYKDGYYSVSKYAFNFISN
jgi:hypothetical protein